MGSVRIFPDCDGWSSKQLYLPDTAVLITRFLCALITLPPRTR
jgi:hypothetical protein